MKYDLVNQLERKQAISYFKKLLDDNCKVEVRKILVTRSLSQNSYLHVCLSLSAMFSGYTIKEMKEVFKKAFGLTYVKNGVTFLKSTADYDTKEMTDFIEYIREQNGMEGNYIPTPNEYLENKFAIDKEIEKNKNFLN